MDERERRKAFIRREYGQGRMSAREIGDALGISRNTVIGIARRLGLHLKHGSDDLRVRRSTGKSRPVNRMGGHRGKRAPRLPIPKAVRPRPAREPSEVSERRRSFPNPTGLLDRGRPGETLRAVEAVAERIAPKDRLCAWRTYEGNGRSMPCCDLAKPGHMWCTEHLLTTQALRESA